MTVCTRHGIFPPPYDTALGATPYSLGLRMRDAGLVVISGFWFP
jgi:hypothetical protein